MTSQCRAWDEYDSAARWCAQRKLRGTWGDPLPENLSTLAMDFIRDDIEAFEKRVRECAYAMARDRAEGGI